MKVYKTEKKKNKLSAAWLGLMETGSILIKQKRNYLSKISDRVSQMFWSASAQGLKGKEEFIEVYIDNPSVFVIIYKSKWRSAFRLVQNRVYKGQN